MSATEPTPRQVEYLRGLAAFKSRHGFSPTIRELGRVVAIGKKPVTTNAVADALWALRIKELITWQPGMARTLALTTAGAQALKERGAA